jgi:prepilin peptidase CpaA
MTSQSLMGAVKLVSDDALIGAGDNLADTRETVLQIVVLILGVSIFAVVAYGDIRTRRIPNELIVALLALAAFRIALAGDPAAGLYTLAASAALFVATFLLFWRGLLGGGDVKLLVATGFLIGYHDLFQFLFVMSVSGALVALAVLARDRLRPATMPVPKDQEIPARLTVPYGVAIAAAGILTLLVQSFSPR